jgi:hypothetical protein
MIRWGLILAVVIIAAGAWFDWSYHAVRMEVAELQSRLKDGRGADTAADCARVSELQSNPVAALFRRKRLAALAKRCEAIKAEGETPHNP